MGRRSAGVLGLVVVAGLALVSLIRSAVAPASRTAGSSSTMELGEAMGGDDAGFARALEPRDFLFPEDHGPHPAFRTEWWYVTANLESADGRRFGTQFTLFRNALAPEEEGAASSSDWATRQVYMGHFAITDVEAEAFHVEERFSRAGAGLAGGESVPLRIWMDDWSLTGEGTDRVFPLRMKAAMADGSAVDLNLQPAKPMVLQGDLGLSQKGPEPGNASYYYSFTRLAVDGRVVVEGDTLTVTGSAWLDREWSTSALSAGQVGWDWFALQLDDGRDLMLYGLRRQDGTRDPLSEGVLVGPDGASTRLTSDDFVIEPLAEWASPLDGARYPSRWRVAVPGQGVELIVAPLISDQELDVTVRYWEGAVDVLAADGGNPVGRGYVELTGYAGADPRRRESSR